MKSYLVFDIEEPYFMRSYSRKNGYKRSRIARTASPLFRIETEQLTPYIRLAKSIPITPRIHDDDDIRYAASNRIVLLTLKMHTVVFNCNGKLYKRIYYVIQDKLNEI